MMDKDLAGLVLCGGYSSRMGSDKGLLLHTDEYWVQKAIDKLESLGLPVWVSVREEQQTIYSSIIPADKLIADAVSVQGPLAGLLTAHQHFPEQDWLVVACDMIDMTQSVLKQLTEVYQNSEKYDCFVFEQEGKWEPLCAIYTKIALEKFLGMVKQGQLPLQSMKYLIEKSHPCFLPITSDSYSAFRNYNQPDDLKIKDPL
ncbi:molybdenum cofactor guanylyltransferase [Cytophagaceae bacterium YF14B1]|uniref:Probable molybdenum cofactor guanylyltransferase n=1 Tax=Xanthocytophaga flava TaxID=3048013 RepID=A0AAE3QGY0_9BACT|nr:molybdenum cofactor guanylyltransferase [Xanthocytophaga flavus]MDJ1479182.1 molybdenum cofactor guanylyltransferase [Xanthocytophaga flavus]